MAWLCVLFLTNCNQPSAFGPHPTVTHDRNTLPTVALFQTPDCVFGCWQGLRPGHSTVQDVEMFFELHLDYDPEHFRREGANFEDQVVYVGTYRDDFTVHAFIQDDTLLSIDVGRVWPMNLTLGEVVSALGDPDYVEFMVRPASEVAGFDRFFRFLYPESGYFFDFFPSDIEVREVSKHTVEMCIGEDVFVHGFRLVEPGTIYTMLHDLGPSLNIQDTTVAYLDILIEQMDTGFQSGCREIEIN